jgi:DNA-3-methyladenine glycosylase I
MSKDVIIGPDGKPRCSWAGAGETALSRYHDEVWGTRSYDEHAMFEALTLGVFDVGLSWSIVFGKRDAFEKALRGFDVTKGGGDDHARRRSVGTGRLDHPQPSQDPGDRRQCPRNDVRVAEPCGAREVLRDHPQAVTAINRRPPLVGVVNDHVHGCFRAVDYLEASSSR